MENKGLSYKEYSQGRRFLVKILPGESLVARIADLIKVEKIQAAVVLSAIGSVKNVKLKDIKSGAKLPITPARLVTHDIEGPLELLGISGNIVPGEGEGIEPRAVGWVTHDLAPGRYEVVCNLPGHYAAGMRQLLTVS